MRKRINLNLIICLSILSGFVMAAYLTMIIIKYPLIGIKVLEENGQWVVEKVYENGWAANYPIEKGDIIGLINEKRVDDHTTVSLFNRVEKAESITILEGNDGRIHYSISYDDMNSKYTLSLLIPLFFSIITLFLSIFLYIKAQRDKSAIILIYFLLSIGICYLGAFVSARGDLVGWFFTHMTLLGSIVLLFHFLKEYFFRYGTVFIKKSSLNTLYLANLMMLLMIYTNRIILGAGNTSKIELLFFSISIFTLVVHLLSFYIKKRNSKESAVIKVLGITITLAFGPFIFFYAIPNMFLGEEFIPTEIAAIPLILIPVSLVYLLLAEKLFDIAFIMGRLRYYSLLSFPFAIVSVLIVSFLSRNQLTIQSIILLFVTFFICGNLLLYIKEYLDYKIKHHLFSRKGDFEMSLFNFFQKAKYETKVESLVSYLQSEIADVLGIDDVLYSEVIVEEEGQNWSVKNKENYPLGHVQRAEGINWAHHGIGNLAEGSDGFGIIIGEDDHQKKVIVFGMKSAKTDLNIQEKVWLETLAYFSSILLENFQLIEDLFDKIEDYKGGNNYPPWLSRLLFSLAEKERTNLSIDLHDSVLQDQLGLLREIENMATRATDSDMKNNLKNLKEGILDNIHMVRETCNELQPPFLSEVGVIQSIQNLVDQTNLRCSFTLTSELDPSIQWLDKEVELALYRVVQELLNNAMEHSQATQVQLTLRKNDPFLSLIYHDDGVGFDVQALNDSFKTMGLFGVKERVKSLGGTIGIDSAEGKGLSVHIELREGNHKHD